MDKFVLSDRIDCKPVKLTLGDKKVKLYYFTVATEIPANHKVEVKRLGL